MKLDAPFEFKASSSSMEIEGLGSFFGNVDLGGDVVLPGAFQKTIAEHKAAGSMPKLLWQHNSDQPIGVWKEMREVDNGLYMKGEFADTQLGREARTLAQMGAVGGLSIGFQLRDFDFNKQGDRLIKEVDLWETSVVTFPMNPKATIEAVKSLFDGKRSMEDFLRNQGLSQRVAKGVMKDIFSSGQSDTDDLFQSSDAADEEEKELLEQIAKMRERLEAGTIRSHINRRFGT